MIVPRFVVWASPPFGIPPAGNDLKTGKPQGDYRPRFSECDIVYLVLSEMVSGIMCVEEEFENVIAGMSGDRSTGE
jgi:hypothetical protein